MHKQQLTRVFKTTTCTIKQAKVAYSILSH